MSSQFKASSHPCCTCIQQARADQDRAAAPLASEAPRSLAWCTHKTAREYVVLGYNYPRPRRPRRAPRLLVSGRTRSMSTSPCAARPGASARREARRSSSTTPGSSSTTSTPPRVRVPRHVARLVMPLVTPLVVDYSASCSLVVDYSVRRDFVLRPRWLYFSHAVGRDYLPCGNTGSTSSTPRRHGVVFRSHRVDHSSRLVFQTSRERQSRPQQLVGINSD
jgi:hypothetical protein